MKKIFSTLLFLHLFSTAFPQVDFSGKYAFEEKVYVDKDAEIKPSKSDQGRSGELTIFKIADNKYKFWLSASRGWPSYNQGTLDGIFDVKNNKGIFTKDMGYGTASCSIDFRFNDKFIQLSQNSTDMDCGFGHAVYADGEYKKKSSKALTNADLAQQYPGASECKVITEKSIVYEDAKGKVAKKQYFVKGDMVPGIDETDGFMYVEFISSNGKFIYGWLKKSSLSITKITQD